MDDQSYLDDDIIGFEPLEAQMVMSQYVCAVCHSILLSFQWPNSDRVVIVCPTHGNVEHCGRVTKATVQIEEERAYRHYHEVIRNLPDLWGALINEGFDYERAKAIRKDYVCKKCSGPLYQELIIGDSEHVNLVCPQHGNINKVGYVRKGHDYANKRSYR